MKRIIVLFSLLLISFSANAQILEWLLDDIYSDIKYLGNDIFKAKKDNGKWILINGTGKILDIECDSITNFVEKRALLLDETGLFLKAIIDDKGNLVKKFNNVVRLANCQHFNEGLLPFGVPGSSGDYLFGYMDLYGKTVLPPQYYWAAPFYNGKAVVQSTSRYYTIINTAGNKVLVYNKSHDIEFISTPVEGKLVYSYDSKRGYRLVSAKFNDDGTLKFLSTLEQNPRAQLVVDKSYKYIEINGKRYNLDNSLRLVSLGETSVYDDSERNQWNVSYGSSFKKVRNGTGWKISFNDRIILHSDFKDIEFYEDSYAVVLNKSNHRGVLKLNANGGIELINLPEYVESYHNLPAFLPIDVKTFNTSPNSIFKLGIKGGNDSVFEHTFDIRGGYNTTHSCPVEYSVTNNDVFNVEKSEELFFNLYLNDILIKSVKHQLTVVHRPGFKISSISAPKLSNIDNKANISFRISPVSISHAVKATVTINGTVSVEYKDVVIPKDGKTFNITVDVPKGVEKEYVISISVKEKGCPVLTKSEKVVIKNYYLL